MDVADVAGLPAIRRYVANLLRLAFRVVRRFLDDKCVQRASALAYASLLAIIPFVALGFSIFTSFRAFETVAGNVREALLRYLLPTSQDVVQEYLGSIAEGATALSIFGILGLLFTATALLNTVEEAFNHIWRVSRARPWFSKFIVFWSTLTLAPILIGTSITITSYFTALPVIRQVAEGAAALGGVPFLLPWLMSSLALTLLYIVLPNTRVPFRFAAVGGLAAGFLFELGKIGFAFYVTELAHYERVYGALGTLPLFLIWLYLAWVVVLLGAEIAFCLQHPEQSTRTRIAFLRPGAQQFYDHLILVRAAQALHEGRPLTLRDLAGETAVPDNILQEWLDALCDRGLLRRTADGDADESWTLGREAQSLSLADIHDALNDAPIHIPDEWLDTALGRILSGLYHRLGRDEEDVLGAMNLHELALRECGQSAREE